MISSADLLKLAKEAVTPVASPAALSRAVSTAYYALFHALLETARARVTGAPSAELLARYVASFDHKQLFDAATQVLACENPELRGKLQGGKPKPWTTLFPPDPGDVTRRQPSANLLETCLAFVKLQQLRHQADYRAEWEVPLAEAQQHVAEAESAINAWHGCADTDEALVFLFGSLGILTFR